MAAADRDRSQDLGRRHGRRRLPRVAAVRGAVAEPGRGRLPDRRRRSGPRAPPVRRLLGRPAAGADRDLRGGRRARRRGAAAAARRARGGADRHPVPASSGRLAAPERRSAPRADRRHGGGVRGHAAVRRQRRQRRAARAAVPGRPGWRRTSPRRPAGRRAGRCPGRSPPEPPGRWRRWSSRACVDVFVLAAVLAFTSSAAAAAAARLRRWGAGRDRGRGAGRRVGARHRVRPTSGRPWSPSASTPPASSPRDSGNAPGRLAGLLGALAASGVPLVVAAFAWKGRGDPSVQGPWTAPDLRVAAYVVLAFELLVAGLGGSYWLHYLMGLVPGVVLVAAAFASGRRRSRAASAAAFALAGLSSAGVIGWVAVHPIDRPEEAAIAYLDEHAAARRHRGGGVRRGQRRPRRRPGRAVPLPVEPAGPGPRRRPRRPRPDCSGARSGRAGCSWPSGPSTTGTSTSPAARAELDAELRAGRARPASSPSTAATTRDPARPRGRGVRRRPPRLVLRSSASPTTRSASLSGSGCSRSAGGCDWRAPSSRGTGGRGCSPWSSTGWPAASPTTSASRRTSPPRSGSTSGSAAATVPTVRLQQAWCGTRALRTARCTGTTTPPAPSTPRTSWSALTRSRACCGCATGRCGWSGSGAT